MTLFSFLSKLHLTKNVGGFFFSCVHWDNTCIVSTRNNIKLEDTEKCDKTENMKQ